MATLTSATTFSARRDTADRYTRLSSRLSTANTITLVAHGCARIAHHRTRRHRVATVLVQRPHERPESARDGRHRHHRWHALAAMFHRPADLLDVHAQQGQVPGEPRLGQHEQRVDAVALRLADHAEVQPDRHVGKARPLRRAEVVRGDRSRAALVPLAPAVGADHSKAGNLGDPFARQPGGVDEVAVERTCAGLLERKRRRRHLRVGRIRRMHPISRSDACARSRQWTECGS